jgi:hypothetical protein
MSGVASCPVFPVFGVNDTALNHISFVGLELFDNRPQRFETLLQHQASVRYGLMLDTGAEENLCGAAWFNRFCNDYDLNSQTTYVSSHTSFSGVGQGSASSSWKVTFPIGLGSFNGLLETQLVEGSGSRLPNLLGLRSMKEKAFIIDLPAMKVSVLFQDGLREAFDLYYVAGHLVLSCDEFVNKHSTFGVPLPTKEVFISDTLGLHGMSTEHSTPEMHHEQHEQQHEQQATHERQLFPSHDQLKEEKLSEATRHDGDER